MRIDRSGFEGRVHAGKNVAKITITKITDVGARKRFALTKAPARVRQQNEIARGGQRHRKTTDAGPTRLHGCARSAMHVDDEWIFFGRIEMQRINQPALHVVAVAFPLKAFQLSPSWLHVFVLRGELCPVANFSGPDLGRSVERTDRERRRLS